MECHVLNDFRRVFTQREIVKAISGGRESGNLGRYLARNPLIRRMRNTWARKYTLMFPGLALWPLAAKQQP